MDALEYLEIIENNKRKVRLLEEEFHKKEEPIIASNTLALNEYLKNAIYDIGDKVLYQDSANGKWKIGFILAYSIEGTFSLKNNEADIQYILNKSKNKGTEISKFLANYGFSICKDMIKPII